MKIEKEQLILLALVSLSIFVPIFLAKAIGKDGYLASDIAKLLFPTLIQVNATLIGFWGIVFVYFLKALDERKTHFHAIMVNAADKMDELLLKKASLNEKEKKIFDRWADDVKGFSKRIKRIDNTQRFFGLYGIFVIAAFLSSILFCVVSLGRIEDVGIRVELVELVLIPLLFGVGFSFIRIWTLVPEAPKMPEKRYTRAKP